MEERALVGGPREHQKEPDGFLPVTVPVGSNVVGGLIGIGLLHLVWVGPLAIVMQCCMCGMTIAHTKEIPVSSLGRASSWQSPEPHQVL